MENAKGIQISKKTFINTIIILLVIMITVGILTRVLPQGSYDYTTNDLGNTVPIPGTYHVIDADPLPIWRWFTAPFEVFATDDFMTALGIILFILLIGGAFLILEKCGVLNYLIVLIISKFKDRRYTLLFAVTFICMLMGSVVGMFEETVVFVPLLVSISLALGWDTLVGMGMSILAVGFGFASGTFNVFTIGIAQKLAGLPMYSGIGFRIIIFFIIYALLAGFLYLYVRRIEKDPKKSIVYESDLERRAQNTGAYDTAILKNKKVKNATIAFGIFFASVFVYIALTFVFEALRDYILVVLMIVFAVGSLVAGKISQYTKKGMFKDFAKGTLSILPGIAFILLALSAKHIAETGNIMDTILDFGYRSMQGLNPFVAILIVYAFVLALQFFISGAAAKAFLIIPLMVNLAELIGLTRQTIVQAFSFGDGFTNMFFPTNPVLLISLGLVSIPYTKWFRWTWKLQLAVLIVTGLLLLVAVKMNYGPY